MHQFGVFMRLEDLRMAWDKVEGLILLESKLLQPVAELDGHFGLFRPFLPNLQLKLR